MRPILPGGLRVCMTPSEFADLVASATRDDAGMVRFAVPEECVDRESPRLVLAHPCLVRYEDKQTELTSLQHAVLRFLLSRGGSVDVGEALSAVWLDPEIEDSTVRGECSRLTKRLRKAGIPYKVSSRGGKISLLQDCSRNATNDL